MVGSSFPGNLVVRIQGERFSVLKEFADFEIDSSEELELLVLSKMSSRTLTSILTAAYILFMVKLPTPWNRITSTVNKAVGMGDSLTDVNAPLLPTLRR